MKIIYAADYQDLSQKAASIIAAQVLLYPNSVLGLATGSTPIGTYEKLVELYQKEHIDFSGVTTINLDEYCGLAADHPQSYRHFMTTQLFSKVNIKAENTHLPIGTADPELECTRYDALISACGGIDLQLLGLGNNGHIGFNEPGDSFKKATHCVDLSENTILANTRFFNSPDEVPRKAITVGLKTIMQAKRILLVVSGDSKAEILQQALYGPITPAVPASILQLHPDVTVITDIN